MEIILFNCFLDGPQVTLLGAPEGDLEENKDEVTLRCVADANPPAKIVWRKSGRQEPFSYEVKLVQIAIANFLTIYIL